MTNQCGSICIFTYNGSSWVFSERDSMNVPAPNTIFGTSVDVKGDYLVVGAPNYGTVGRAFVYFKMEVTGSISWILPIL